LLNIIIYEIVSAAFNRECSNDVAIFSRISYNVSKKSDLGAPDYFLVISYAGFC